jgi:hypothetical protein
MRKWFTAAVLLAMAGAAHADEGFVYLGAGVTRSSVSDIAAIGTKLEGTAWKAFGGFRPIKLFAVEADYIDLGSRSSQYVNTNTNLHYEALAGYAVVFAPIPLPYLDVFGKLGVARWSSSGSATTFPGGSLFSLSGNGTEFAWGVGTQAFFGHFGGRLEYEGFNIPNTSGASVVSLSVILSL